MRVLTEVEKLLYVIKIQKEALEHYADKNNYYCEGKDRGDFPCGGWGHDSLKNDSDFEKLGQDSYSGNRARKVNQRVKEILE